MKKITLTLSASIFLSSLCCFAQQGARKIDPNQLLTKNEKSKLQNQALGIYRAASPVTKTASQSTVTIHLLGRQVAFGTAVKLDDGTTAILTKLSEVQNNKIPITVKSNRGQAGAAELIRSFPTHDLALLRTSVEVTPIDLNNSINQPALGSFIVQARPDGVAHSVGVVSVNARSLREQDKAFLGVAMDFKKKETPGVLITQVTPESAAADAGILVNDTILSIEGTPVNGPLEMRNLLQKINPGTKIKVSFKRGDATNETVVTLGAREGELARQFPRRRMQAMQRMGTSLNRVRTNFPEVIQSDMPLLSEDMGAPVVDLAGRLVGISIARGSRIKSFVTPTATIKRLLANPE